MQQLNGNPVSIDATLMKSFHRYVEEYNGKKQGELVSGPHGHLAMKPDSNTFFSGLSNTYYLDKYSNKGQLQKQLHFEYEPNPQKIQKITWDIKLTERIDDLFSYKEVYYPSGKIKSKAIFCEKGFYISKTYSFDEDGKVINIKDNDVGYNFTFDDVFRFCNRERLLDNSKKGNVPYGQRLSIGKGLNGNWIVGISTPSTFLFTLDPNSGKVLSLVLMAHAQPVKTIPIKPNKKRVKYIKPESWYP